MTGRARRMCGVRACAGMTIGTILLAGCATVPYTNRRQFNIVSEAEEDQMGAQAYADVRAKSKISGQPQENEMLRSVGKRIAAAADKPEYKWEFILIDDPKTINAFCLPGGRVAFYTGILPVTKDENGIAVVMAHEVAHALARHGAERVSEAQAVGLAEQVAVQSGLIKTQGSLQMVELAYGVGVGLPHSRGQEAEADHIGLILMAKAGYDPRGAVAFWERMKAASGSGKPPEFLSTHPSDEKRIQKIKEELPEALTYYKPR
jgi:predicted Zn-dependent protease